MVFPIQKWGFLPKFKEVKRLRGGVVYYAAQARAQIDAEIGQKDHLWMETSYCHINGNGKRRFFNLEIAIYWT